MTRLEKHRDFLEGLTERGRRRTLEKRHGLDFSSNDYLALSDAPELRAAAQDALARGVGLGAGGSRLLRGNDPEHEALEFEAARFFGAERALYFGGGFNANMAIFATLPQKDDLVVYDRLIHASAHDGMKLGRASSKAFSHNNPQAASDAINIWRKSGGKGQVWLAFESLYSMDGDKAHVEDLVSVADQNDGFALIDEAHATGVYGPSGRGLASAFDGRENVITLHTCGKALGVSGGLICGPAIFIDYLVNRARSFIFATAPSPLMAAMVRVALKLMQEQPERREKLAQLVRHANQQLTQICGRPASGTQILPVIVGEDQPTMKLAAAMQARGFDIRGIRPPTVPAGTARLRIALTLHNDKDAVTAMLNALSEEMAAEELEKIKP